ncbi:transposase [Thalassotalea fonticola]|uniref:Transposase n=1 Tax=Thalassotalea fonticola TaxID=3065649 RepID=A0ABZ0GQC8_9GAMM|nr:transposase [Colwelliaceae bacterium S1-1]
MPKPRKQQISLIDTPYYHCTSRCVRRAYLCGKDSKTNKSYEHRRGWVEKRLIFLSQAYAIDICAYAIMSNHTHIVIKINPEKAKSWTDLEVLNRWHKLHFGTQLTKKYCKGEDMSIHLSETFNETVKCYRKRLVNVSWFMRDLNEYIARRANSEDECTGRFWEGRFGSQPLLDEAALLSCMAYVDLNPVRAKIANLPEDSEFTSAHKRIQATIKGNQPNYLLPFTGHVKAHKAAGISFQLKDYLQLIDETGKTMRDDKRGYIDENNNKILSRLSIREDNWLDLTREFETIFKGAVGAHNSLERYYYRQQYKRRPNLNQSEKLSA